MTGNRNKTAWIWLTVAAMTAMTFARAQAGGPSTAPDDDSVFAFLSGHSMGGAFGAQSSPTTREYRSDRRLRTSTPGIGTGAWMAVVPILFVGLIAPLSLISPGAVLSLGRACSAPALPFLFQRPPPSLRF